MNVIRKAGPSAWLLASASAALALYPYVTERLEAQDRARRLTRVEAALVGREPRPVVDRTLSLRVARLEGLLASWQTVGGCGAGSSTGAGGGVKWVGRGTSGGLFNLQLMSTYLHLDDGYNLGLTTELSRDFGDTFTFGVAVPLLYKYYRDYYGLAVDVSNGGLGDVSAFGTVRFGEIKATALTLSVGIPTGTYDAKYKNDYLTQEKQLGLGKVTGNISLEHTMDKEWGLILFGGTFSYRGGENELGNYRAPLANVYGYGGYYLGPWVPSLGLTVQRYLGVDRDRGLDQQVQLMSVTGTFALEWSTDWLALLVGVSLPFGWDSSATPDGSPESDVQTAGLQPWTVGLGISVSPF